MSHKKGEHTKETTQGQDEVKALFQGDDNDANDNSFAEGFKDRIRAVHEHFDADKDGHLNFPELAALQLATEGTKMGEEMYIMACRALDCNPNQGISLDALRLTYAAEGTSIDKDYYKVFPDKKPKPIEKGDDYVYEVGKDGVDISD